MPDLHPVTLSNVSISLYFRSYSVIPIIIHIHVTCRQTYMYMYVFSFDDTCTMYMYITLSLYANNFHMYFVVLYVLQL